MASSYPGGLDALTNPTATDSLASPSHATQHANANDAIEAIQGELGTNPSGSEATVAARFTTIEAAGWVTSTRILDGTIVNADINAAAAIDPSKINGTAVVTGDSRLSDARTPTAHAASHASAGSDPITVAQSQVTNLTSDLAAKAPTANPTLTGIVTHDLGSAAAPSITYSGDTNTGIYSPGADSIALVTGGTARLSVDSSGLITGTGTSLGAATAYSPALGGTGWAVGDGSTSGAYIQIGKLVWFWARLTWGTTTTAGSGTLAFTLPVNRQTTRVEYVGGRINDVSAGDNWFAQAQGSSATQMQIRWIKPSTVTLKALNTTDIPVTFASGDTITITGIYEAA